MAGNGCYATYNSQNMDFVLATVDYSPVTEGGALVAYNQTVRFKSYFKYGTYAAWYAGKNAIIAALKVQKQTLTIIDVNANTRWSFASSDCVGGNGPYVKFKYEPIAEFAFYIDAEFYGEVPPAGSGTLVNEYTDTYEYDTQDRVTYTRTGTQASSSAYTDMDTALTAVDPAPGDGWEYVTKRGEFDQDEKVLKYTWVYREPFEDLPSGFVTMDYTINESADGRKKSITISGTGGIDYDDKGSLDSLQENIETWAKGKLSDTAKIQSINTSMNKREGQCNVNLSAVDVVNDDVLEYTESHTTSTVRDYVVIKRLGGGGGFKQKVGSDDIIQRSSGRAVGLNTYPMQFVSDGGDRAEYTKEEPYKGPDGELLYAVSWSNEWILIGDDGGGGAGGGAAGGGGGSGIGSGGAGRTGSNSIPIGDIGGFTTGGATSGATGGLFGSQSGFSTQGLIGQ